MSAPIPTTRTASPVDQPRRTSARSNDDFDFDKPAPVYASPPHPHYHNQRAMIIFVEEEQVEEEDPEAARVRKFQDKAIRKKFVKNVMLALCFKFAVCASFIVLGKTIPEMEEFFHTPGGQAVTWVSFGVYFILLIAISCCGVGRGKPNPLNVGLLLLTTLLVSVYATAITIQYDIFSIMLAAGVTAGVLLILAVVTIFTKLDVTDKSMYIMGAFLALFLFGIIASIAFPVGWISPNQDNILQMVIAAGFCMLYVVLILMQMQLIMGGRSNQYSEYDWLIASITLFFDILMFFLTFLGISRRINN